MKNKGIAQILFCLDWMLQSLSAQAATSNGYNNDDVYLSQGHSTDYVGFVPVTKAMVYLPIACIVPPNQP